MLYLFSSLQDFKSLLYFCIIGRFVIKTILELINERNLLKYDCIFLFTVKGQPKKKGG